MLHHTIAYGVTAIAFCAIDLAWLSVMAKRFYAARLGGLVRNRPRMGAAIVFYGLYVLAIVIFAVAPALAAGNAISAAVYGALFGFFAYATYDLTNYITLRGWPLVVTLVDMAWGTFLTGASATLGYLGARMFL